MKSRNKVPCAFLACFEDIAMNIISEPIQNILESDRKELSITIPGQNVIQLLALQGQMTSQIPCPPVAGEYKNCERKLLPP